MLVLPLPFLLLLGPVVPQGAPSQIQELHQSAIEANKANEVDRAVFLLRRAVAESRPTDPKPVVQDIRALLAELSPKEAKRRKLISSAAQVLRKAAQNYSIKGMWAQALPLLSLAQRIEPTAKGSKALISCLFGQGDSERKLPLEKLLAAEIAKDANAKDYVLPFKMDGEALLTPTWKTDRSFFLPSGLAVVPGIQIDCEIKLAAPEAKAGFSFGVDVDDQPYCLVEIRQMPKEKYRGMAIYKFIPPPRNTYAQKAFFWEEVGKESWRRLHIEVRSQEMTIALDDSSSRVVFLPGETLDGDLVFHHTSTGGHQVRNAYRNLRVQPLPSADWQIRQLPEKLPEKTLRRLLASADRAVQLDRAALAETYLQRASILSASSLSKSPMTAVTIERRRKAARLDSKTKSARASAAKKLQTLAKAEAKDGRKSLATHYRLLSQAAERNPTPRSLAAKDRAALCALMPQMQALMTRAQSLGNLKGWENKKDLLRSPAPVGETDAMLLLPGSVCAGTAIFFELRYSRSASGFVFGHRNTKDQYTLGFEIGKTELSVFLDQELGDEPLSLMEFTVPIGKIDITKDSLPVLILLQDHHVLLKIGRLAPRIIPLDKRRLQGRIGFRLLPNTGPAPFTVTGIQLLPH